MKDAAGDVAAEAKEAAGNVVETAKEGIEDVKGEASKEG